MTIDFLAHTRDDFNRERVVAGPVAFYALSRGNLAIGPVRATQAEAEADADHMYETYERMRHAIIGWGAR